MQEKKSVNLEKLKSILTTPEGLGIVCYSKHHQKAKINSANLSEILKIPVSKLKEVAAVLEEQGIVRINKAGVDSEFELLQHEDDRVRHLIDEIIWENKEEYGKIYKRIVTAELMDFMEGK